MMGFQVKSLVASVEKGFLGLRVCGISRVHIGFEDSGMLRGTGVLREGFGVSGWASKEGSWLERAVKLLLEDGWLAEGLGFFPVAKGFLLCFL